MCVAIIMEIRLNQWQGVGSTQRCHVACPLQYPLSSYSDVGYNLICWVLWFFSIKFLQWNHSSLWNTIDGIVSLGLRQVSFYTRFDEKPDKQTKRSITTEIWMFLNWKWPTWRKSLKLVDWVSQDLKSNLWKDFKKLRKVLSHIYWIAITLILFWGFYSQCFSHLMLHLYMCKLTRLGCSMLANNLFGSGHVNHF